MHPALLSAKISPAQCSCQYGGSTEWLQVWCYHQLAARACPALAHNNETQGAASTCFYRGLTGMNITCLLSCPCCHQLAAPGIVHAHEAAWSPTAHPSDKHRSFQHSQMLPQLQHSYSLLQDFEDSHPVSPTKPGSAGSAEELFGDSLARRERTVALLRMGRALKLSEETGHDAAQLLDRLGQRGLPSADAGSPVVLAATLLVSAEQGGHGLPHCQSRLWHVHSSCVQMARPPASHSPLFSWSSSPPSPVDPQPCWG